MDSSGHRSQATGLSDALRYEQNLHARGLSTAQKQAMAWVPEGSRVLELGCASGYLGQLLIQNKGCRVTGVEIDPAAAECASARGLEMHVGCLEDTGLLRSISGPYDVVMATDVIEHLRQPRRMLAELPRWLRPGGRAIISVPNVAIWSMRLQLLRGKFEYRQTGLLDHTHLRFFTWDSIWELVRSQGWSIDQVVVDTWEVPGCQTVLWDFPLWLRDWLTDKRLGPESGRKLDSWRQRLATWAFHRAGETVVLHQSWGERLGRRWPNLCAKHIALLLTLPDSRDGEMGG